MQTTVVRVIPRRLAQAFTPSGPLPAMTRAMWWADGVLAVLLCCYGIADQRFGTRRVVLRGEPLFVSNVALHHSVLALFAMVLVTLPIAVRRRYPLTAFLLVFVVGALTFKVITPWLALATCLIGAYSAARYSPYRLPALALPLMAGAVISGYFAPALPEIPNVLTAFAILVPLTLAADSLRTARQRAEENRARISALEREQDERMRRAVQSERSRIARELHDVVTHNVSVMVVQAGAARKIMTVAPDDAREALLAVEASGRSAMAELRQVMGLLIADDQPSDELAPQPGLDRLPALVDSVRATGVTVDLDVTGEPRPLPQGIDLAAYRVVQEALTNAMKHAVGASVRIAVDRGPERLEITVTDSGGRPGTAAAAGNGRGLIGLHERLAVYGGSLAAGPAPGGYRVRAGIPLEHA